MGTPPGKTAPRWPSHSLSLGDTTSTPPWPTPAPLSQRPRAASYLRSGRRLGSAAAGGSAWFDSVSLFACGHRSLRACGSRRLWEKEMSRQPEQSSRGQFGEQPGAVHTGSLIPPGWAINTHTSHTQTHTHTLLLTHSHLHTRTCTRSLAHLCLYTRTCSHMYTHMHLLSDTHITHTLAFTHTCSHSLTLTYTHMPPSRAGGALGMMGLLAAGREGGV